MSGEIERTGPPAEPPRAEPPGSWPQGQPGAPGEPGQPGLEFEGGRGGQGGTGGAGGTTGGPGGRGGQGGPVSTDLDALYVRANHYRQASFATAVAITVLMVLLVVVVAIKVNSADNTLVRNQHTMVDNQQNLACAIARLQTGTPVTIPSYCTTASTVGH